MHFESDIAAAEQVRDCARNLAQRFQVDVLADADGTGGDIAAKCAQRDIAGGSDTTRITRFAGLQGRVDVDPDLRIRTGIDWNGRVVEQVYRRAEGKLCHLSVGLGTGPDGDRAA